MAQKIKLLIVTHNYPRFDGDFAGVFIALLAKNLLRFGIEPVVLAPHDAGAKEYEERDGVKIYRFRYADTDADENIAYRGSMHKLVFGSAGGIFRFRHFLDRFRTAAAEIIEKEKIEIIAGHWLVPSGMVIKPLVSRYHLPYIMSSHGTDIRLIRMYFNVTYSYFRTFCLGLKRWTVVSSYLRNEIIALDKRVESLIEVLPVPHDETVFYRDESIPRDPNLIVAVTRFTAQKRIDHLIKAFALVTEKRPDVRLEIYGEGSLVDETELLIEKFGLNDRVNIKAPVPQAKLREVYNRAAIVVLNSYREGFGLALSEGMLCGAAAVGTNSGGITDIIKHNERGLLVELDNSAALAEALLLLLNDSQLRERLARAGYDYARATYTSTALAGRYAAIVKNALA